MPHPLNRGVSPVRGVLAGGNLTVRVGDRVYMSRSYSGAKWQWQVGPEDFLVLDLDGQILAGEGDV